MITQATASNNERQGNGRFGVLRRNKKKSKKASKSQEFTYLDKHDLRMRFNGSKDPIYAAFDYLDKQSLTSLAGDFVKDTLFAITNFVSKTVR